MVQATVVHGQTEVGARVSGGRCDLTCSHLMATFPRQKSPNMPGFDLEPRAPPPMCLIMMLLSAADSKDSAEALLTSGAVVGPKVHLHLHGVQRRAALRQQLVQTQLRGQIKEQKSAVEDEKNK